MASRSDAESTCRTLRFRRDGCGRNRASEGRCPDAEGRLDMTGHDEPTSVWEHLDELTDGDRELLVESAVTVLNQGVQPDEAITRDMPRSVLRSRMASALSEAGLPASKDDASAAMSSASGADA